MFFLQRDDPLFNFHKVFTAMAFHCAVCNASLNSSSRWTQHVSGSKHQQKLLQTNGASGTDTVVDELGANL